MRDREGIASEVFHHGIQISPGQLRRAILRYKDIILEQSGM
jgi:hypothetical protein